jgi:hypothetical protein
MGLSLSKLPPSAPLPIDQRIDISTRRRGQRRANTPALEIVSAAFSVASTLTTQALAYPYTGANPMLIESIWYNHSICLAATLPATPGEIESIATLDVLRPGPNATLVNMLNGLVVNSAGQLNQVGFLDPNFGPALSFGSQSVTQPGIPLYRLVSDILKCYCPTTGTGAQANESGVHDLSPDGYLVYPGDFLYVYVDAKNVVAMGAGVTGNIEFQNSIVYTELY